MTKRLSEHEIEMAESIFRKYLRDCGLKYTAERKKLLHEALSNDEHFEAEQLLITMRQAGKRVAKATIYRTLPLLVNCGIIKQVQFGDNLIRYEHTFAKDAHDHMICHAAGELSSLTVPMWSGYEASWPLATDSMRSHIVFK